MQMFVAKGAEGQIFITPSSLPGTADFDLMWDDNGNCLDIHWANAYQVTREDLIKILNSLVRSATPPAGRVPM
jgi:hypothetical protein